MKVLLYKGGKNIIQKSGIGRSIELQEQMLGQEEIAYTADTSEKYDIVQLNTVLPDSILVALKAKMTGKKIVYYGHSTMEDFKQSFKGSNTLAPIFKQWIKFCYGFGDIVVTPSSYSKQLIENYGLKKPVIDISNGIDLNYYKKEEMSKEVFCQKYGLNPDKKIIMSVGHYIERKGIIDFVELAKSMPQYQFVWFGHTDLSLIPKKIQQAVKTELPNLIFAGYVTKEDIKEAYNLSDLFLFLTYEETEGMVLFEALAMKIPVLIRDIPIYEKMFDRESSLYKACDNDNFKEKISGILENKLKDLTEYGYHEAEKRSLDNVGKRLKTMYQTIIDSDKPSVKLRENKGQL